MNVVGNRCRKQWIEVSKAKDLQKQYRRAPGTLHKRTVRTLNTRGCRPPPYNPDFKQDLVTLKQNQLIFCIKKLRVMVRIIIIIKSVEI